MKRNNIQFNLLHRTKSPICKDCNTIGTKECGSTCHCLEGYTGTWCEKCLDERSYADPLGHCKRCPCSMEVSDGQCHFDSSRQMVVCQTCNPGYAGLLCDTCEMNYHKNTTSGLCEKGFAIKESLSEGITGSYSRRFILFSSVGVPIVLAVTVALLYLTYRCLSSRSNVIRSTKLSNDPRSNIAEVDEITFNVNRPSVFQRFLDVISFGRNKTEDRFLLSDYSLQDRHYSLFDEPSDDVFDSEFEHLETIIHPNSSGPSKKGPNEKTRIFENPLASASVNNCRQPNGVTKFNAILPPSSNYQSCDDVTFGDDLESDRQSEPEMQWDEDLNGVTHDYPFSVDDNSSGRLTNDAENFATPLRLIDNGNQTVLMSNGTRIDAIQCSPKPIEREAASFYFLASDGSENNGNSNL